MRAFRTPESVNADTYQATHFEQIPLGMENFELSQGIFRKPLYKNDLRLLSGGLTPAIMLERGFAEPITKWDIEEGEWFYKDHYLGNRHPWPKEMFLKIINEHGGYYPLCVTGLPDGQTHYVGEPHIQVWTDVPGMGECVGWVESTLAPYLFNFNIVATRGRKRKERMIEVFRTAYPSKTLDQLHEMVQWKFHDFGRRGAPASQMTGIAHHYNWLGSDTADASYVAARFLNGGKKFGAGSIIAAAHRSITPHPTEDAAYDQIIGLMKTNGYKVIAVVADSYGFERGIRKLAGKAEFVKTNGGFLIGRPDSGDPVKCVVEGLQVFGEAFGTDKQEIGLKVIRSAGIIQGDGVDDTMIFDKIYPAAIEAGFCPSNLAFGMGEHNHIAARSATEWGYKTTMIGTPNGYRYSMKSSDNLWKRSIPGPVAVFTTATENRVRPISLEMLKKGETGDLRVFFDGRPDPLPIERELFGQTRLRAWDTWLAHPPDAGDTFDPALRKMQEDYLAKFF